MPITSVPENIVEGVHACLPHRRQMDLPLSPKPSRGVTCRRIRYRVFSQPGALWTEWAVSSNRNLALNCLQNLRAKRRTITLLDNRARLAKEDTVTGRRRAR
jgi:hypothetical protein